MSYRENREMHKAVRTECGQECEVPFKPDGSRPVYCQECYRNKRPKAKILSSQANIYSNFIIFFFLLTAFSLS